MSDFTSFDHRRTTLVDVLRQRAHHQPDRRAFLFLADGERQEEPITYGELDLHARRIAAELQREGLHGRPVLLLYPPGLAYITAFFGCLYAGALAVPVYPPSMGKLERTLARLRGIVTDAGATLALTSGEILGIARPLMSQDSALAQLSWIATDALAPELAGSWQAPALTPGDIAFLQYTSGSTGAPKGVMLSHANLVHNCAIIGDYFEHTEHTRAVMWLPPYHDMGLIGGILHPLYAGFPMVLMSPLHFLQRPLRWLQAISTHAANTSGAPNFAYDLCARKATPEQVASLDLARWNLAFNGAEPLRHETMQRFAEVFAPAGFSLRSFYPCYGLAEATLIASGGAVAEEPITLDADREAQQDANALVPAGPGASSLRHTSSGRAHPEQEIVIVDPELQIRCAPGQIGEIWLAGPSVARGYWRDERGSRETFGAYLADTGEGPYLRTGDLGALVGGELYVTGRIKDLIIVDGVNHYPQDIERTVEACDERIRPGCCAAFAIEEDREERLVVMYELQPGVPGEDPEARIRAVTGTIRKAVARDHELRLHDAMPLAPRTIPKTSSGKIQRHACKQEYLRRIAPPAP